MARTFASGMGQPYAQLASAPVSNVPLTMACWFYSTSSTAAQNMFVLNQAGSDNNALGITAAGSTGGDPLQFYCNGGGAGFVTASTSAGYTANSWQHACGVAASETSRVIYLNGGNSGSNTTSRTLASIDRTNIAAYIGSVSPPNTDMFIGHLAHMAIWNVALDATEVAALAAMISPLLIRPSSLKFYAPFWGNASPEPEVMQGNSVTLFNSPAKADSSPIIYPPKRRRFIRVAAAGGGTTYTFSSSDSIAYSDSLLVQTNSFRDCTDSIGLSDTVDRACQNLRAVEDNVACSDTVNRVVEYFRAVADSIGIADDVLREISGIREISVADSLAISETYLQVVSYFRDLAESLAFTEDFQRQVDYYRRVSDSIAILESLITALNGIVITPPEEEEEEAAALEVEEDLYAYLLGCHIVTNLIGTRLYPVEAPKEAARPFIVYEILTRDRDDTQAGENGLVRVGIQFDCQAATYTAVREIEEALRGRFYRFYHRLMGTTFVQSAEISDATDEDSPPVFADAQGIYHSRVDLELWYEEAVPV